MIKADLEYIFKDQLKNKEKLFFMLIDGDTKTIMRHAYDDLDGLLLVLDNFQYSGAEGSMPRFST